MCEKTSLYKVRCGFAIAMAMAVGVIAIPGVSVQAAEVESIDWSKVKVNKPRLFYPGQSSYEWLRTTDHKKASNEVKGGEACLKCHKGEQKALGEILIEEGPLEPEPIADKDFYKRIKLQAAHDKENLYLRVSWKTDADRPGDMGNFMQFEDGEWKWFGNHRQHEAVVHDGQPAIYPDRLGIMIGDKSVPMYAEQGCWMTCHETLTGMPEEADEEEVMEHPVIGAVFKDLGFPKQPYVRKYLPESRTDVAAWDALKTAAELKALKDKGAFLDLIIWDASLTNPGGFATDFYVLDFKHVDEGSSPLLPNGKMLHGPKYMFDQSKTGYAALTDADLEDPSKAKHLAVGSTAVPFDAAAMKDGDLLPAHIIDVKNASGSAADVNYAKGVWEDGEYTVVIRRKLDTGHADDKVLKAGGVYTFGFSVHDNASGKRAHHVSFPVTLSIGEGKADIQAVSLQ